MSATAGHGRRSWAFMMASIVVGILGRGLPVAAAGSEALPDRGFETVVLPYVRSTCLSCHATTGVAEAGLSLDSLTGLVRGGDSGRGIVAGKPDESLVYLAIRGDEPEFRMPKDGPAAPGEVVAALRDWILSPAARAAEAAIASEPGPAEQQARRHWWSLAPPRLTPPPAVSPDNPLTRSENPVDRFLAARIAAAGLVPAAAAAPETLLRRACLVLTGLPPTASQRERFLARPDDEAWERLIDELLESPHFAEHWARHWLDCVRYSETHGSEDDPAIPHAWRYRDWVIRAFHDDVPVDQFLREQVAGDLLSPPRLDAHGKVNESAIGIAHFRMVPHGFAPTEPHAELVTFVDNQVDVLSKAVLGLTVSCARCHDHKFDAVSQQDYFAIFGTLAAARPALIQVDAPGVREAGREELAALKERLKRILGEAWLDELAKPEALAGIDARAGLAGLIDRPLGVGLLAPSPPTPWETDAITWMAYDGLGTLAPSGPGAFRITPEGDRIIARLEPAGIHSNLLVPSDGAVVHSRSFVIRSARIRLLVAGDGGARVRLVVRNYPRVPPFLYPAVSLEGGRLKWIELSVGQWLGERAHLEIATAEDLPVEAIPGRKSWFSLVALDDSAAAAPPEDRAAPSLSQVPHAAAAVRDAAPRTAATLAEASRRSARAAIEAWLAGTATDDQIHLLNALIGARALPVECQHVPGAQDILARYRTLAGQLPPPTRAPGLLEGDAVAQPLLLRGDHRTPGRIVPHGFVQAVAETPFRDDVPARLELADRLVAPGNPLTARVFVNRVWQHIFGVGIVATPDDFGRMGQRPSHPELLDYLAVRWGDPLDGSAARPRWSLKRLVRLLVSSRAFRLSARPSRLAWEIDPDNALLSHARPRRLPAESIRDSLLAAAGLLDATLYGPPVAEPSRRRSIYLPVQRNTPSPFLAVFDAPTNSMPHGRRLSTLQPSQTLARLNGDLVRAAASGLAMALSQTEPAPGQAPVDLAFWSVLARPPTAEERTAATDFMRRLELQRHAESGTVPKARDSLEDLAHALFNLDEFVHVE